MKRLALLVLLGAVSCGGPDVSPGGASGAHPASLAGAAWVVISVDGRLPVAGGEPTVAFTPAGVSGSGGCNHFGGSYRYDPATGALEFENLAMTAMACADDRRNQFEAGFSRALQQANVASSDELGHLILTGPGGAIVLANGRQPLGS
ncbi:MAG: META domain-containing protein [Chloroflexi bacterium]|nr:META domain-containing protein [Chloroflexota bacterium]